MYKRRLQAWGYQKNCKEKEVLAILTAKKQRDAVHKPSEFLVRAEKVDMDRVHRYLERRPDLLRRIDSSSIPGHLLALSVVARTPPPCTGLRTEEYLHVREQALLIIAEWYDGCLSSGAWEIDDDGNVLQNGAWTAALRAASWGSMWYSARPALNTRKRQEYKMLNLVLHQAKEVISVNDPSFLLAIQGLFEIEDQRLASICLSFLQRMAALVLGQQHPLSRLLGLLPANSQDSLRVYMLAVVESAAIHSEQQCGPNSCISGELFRGFSYIKYKIYGIDGIEEEYRKRLERPGIGDDIRYQFMDSLATIYCIEDRLDRELEIRRQLLATTSSKVQRDVQSLSITLTEMYRGNFEDAENILRDAVEGIRESERLDLLLDCLGVLSLALEQMDRLEEAEAVAEERNQIIQQLYEESGAEDVF